MNKHNSKRLAGLSVVGLLILVVAASGPASAQGPGAHRHGRDGEFGPGRGLERLAAFLDLTQEQSEAIKTLQENNRAGNLQLRKEMMRLENELKGELLKDKPSEKTVLALNEKMGQLKTELKANRLKTRLAVREQLTPEQRDKMLMRGDRGSRGAERHIHHESHGRRGGREFPGCGPDRGLRLGTCPQTDTPEQ